MSLRSPSVVAVVVVVVMKISQAQVKRNNRGVTNIIKLHRFPTTAAFSRPRVGDSPVASPLATLNIADPGPSCEFDPALGLGLARLATATETLP
jgi:hypothetical protein